MGTVPQDGKARLVFSATRHPAPFLLPLVFSLPQPAIQQAKGFQPGEPAASSPGFQPFLPQPAWDALGSTGILPDTPCPSWESSPWEKRVTGWEQGTNTGDALEQGTSTRDALEQGTSTGDAGDITASHCGTIARLWQLCGSQEKPRCPPVSSLADVSCFPASGAAAAPHQSMPSISSSPHPERGDGLVGSRGRG